MGKVILTSTSSGGTTVANNSNNYFVLGNGWLVRRATEDISQTPYRTPGTISKLYARVTANSTSADCAIRVRINALTSTISVPVPQSTTGTFEDTANTESIAAGDKLSYQITASPTGTMTCNLASVIFDATANIQSSKLVCDGQSITTAAATNYWPLSGQVSGVTTSEANTQHRVKKAGTLKNLCISCSANARITDTVVTMRKNTADTALTTSIIALTTGFFEDISHTVSVAVDDLINFKTVTGSGTESQTIGNLSIEFESANNGFITAGGLGSGAGDLVVNANTTNYVIPGGDSRTFTTEAEAKLKTRTAATLNNLTIWIPINTVTAASTFKLRKNGANGNQTIPIGISATGYFHDTVNTDVVDDDDEIDYQLITGAAGTSMTVRQMAVWTLISNIQKTLTETDTIGELKTRNKASWRLQP